MAPPDRPHDLGADDSLGDSSDLPPSYEDLKEKKSSIDDFQTSPTHNDLKKEEAGANEPGNERVSGYNESSLARPGSSGPTPKRFASVALSMSASDSVVSSKCFQCGPQLRLAVVSSTVFQVYGVEEDTLLWELHGNSTQLVQGNESSFEFTQEFVPSRDGALVGIIASRKDHCRLLVVDANTGWVKSEHSLSPTDDEPHISPDNSKAIICHWDGTSQGNGSHFKMFSLIEEQNQNKAKRIPFKPPEQSHMTSIEFAPDSQHIIACTGPTKGSKKSELIVSVTVYDGNDGRIVRLSTRSCIMHSTASRTMKVLPNFHFSTVDEWLVSFPDYSKASTVCIMNARLGQTVAIVSTKLSVSQRWQVGMLAPGRAEVGYDKTSGIFTKMELSTTMMPRGQTATITKFILSANTGRERAVFRKAFQLKAMVVSCGYSDVCGLSSTGLEMFIQKPKAGKVDIISLAI